MTTMLGSLLVSLGLDLAEFKSGLDDAERQLRASTKRIEKIGQGMQGLGGKLTLAVSAPLVALGVTAVKAAVESNKAVASVEATLKSMGRQAGFTAKQLEEVAGGIMRKSLYDDDEVLQKVTNSLLTFDNVVGGTFLRAQQASVDLAAALGVDLQGAAKTVGKALQDPAKGIGDLTRAGVSFNPAQVKLVKSLIETGKVAKAQEVILKELERQVTGSAEAMRNADPLAALRLSFGEFQEQVGNKLLPLLPRITDAVTKVLDAFSKLSPGMQEALVIAGGLAAAFGPLLFAVGSLTSLLAPAIAGIKTIGMVAAATAIETGSLAAGVGVLRAALVSLIGSLAPYIVALGVVSAVVAALVIRHRQLTQASETYRKAQDAATKAAEKGSAAASQLAMAQGEARKAALLAARQEQRNIAVKLRSAQASLALAKAELITARARADAINQSAAVGDTSGILFGSDQAAKASANLKAQAATVRTYANALREVTAALRQPEIAVSDVAAVATDEKKKGRSGPTGPTVAEIEARFNDELIGYTQQSLSAMQRLAKNADERAELELRSVEWARRQTLAHIAADEDYTAAQKAELSAAVERLAGYEREGIELQRKTDLEREAADLAQIAFDSQREQLALAGDVADTQAERKRIALDILALEQEYRRNQLEMVLASEVASDAEKARAQAILDSLAAIEAGERTSVGRRNETEVEAYLRSLNRSPEQMNEAVSGAYIDGLDALTNGLANALSKVQSLGDAFKSMRDVAQEAIQQVIADLIRLGIQQTINKFLAQAIFGGGGGSPIDLLAGTPYGGARAAGGPIRSGMAYLVGEKGPEVVVPGRSGTVIPNNELGGLRSAGDTHNWNISVSGPMSDREARRTGNQIASAAQQRMAQARRSGIAG